MKQKPELLPNSQRKQFEDFKGKKNEWFVRFKVSYVDDYGEKHNSTTSWFDNWDEALEAKNKLIQKHTSAKPLVSDKDTIEKALKNYVVELKAKDDTDVPSAYVKKLIDRAKHGEQLSREEKKTLKQFEEGKPVKNNYIHKLKNVSSLYKNFFPSFVKNVKVKQVQPSHFIKWLNWINNDQAEHTYIGGASVKRYVNALHSFNQYLYEHGYYDLNQRFLIDASIRITDVKPLDEGARTDRGYPKYEDLLRLGRYYKDKGLNDFKNFYFYTLWYVLFMTGIAPGEAIALRWSAINFKGKNNNGSISIVDSIVETDKRKNTMARIRSGKNKPKTEDRKRTITMWVAYRDLLKDYKMSYKKHFKVNNEEMENMFVFPNITARDETKRTEYQRHDNLNEELKRVCKQLKIEPDYDTQMFRHATINFLCNDKGIKVEDCKAFFGHSIESETIERFYRDKERAKRVSKVELQLEDLIDKPLSDDYDEKAEKITDRLSKYNISKLNAISGVEREALQIVKAVKRGQKVYEYRSKYRKLIEVILEEAPELEDIIEFVEVDDDEL